MSFSEEQLDYEPLEEGEIESSGDESLDLNVSGNLFREHGVPPGVLRERNHRDENHNRLTVWDRLEPRVPPQPEVQMNVPVEEEEEEPEPRFSRFRAERPLPPPPVVLPAQEVLDRKDEEEGPCARKSRRGRPCTGRSRPSQQLQVPAPAHAPPQPAPLAVAPQPVAVPGRARVGRGRGLNKFSPLYKRSHKMAEAELAKRK